MTHPRFFGYGSLVNTATHSYPNAQNGTLSGYRRVWRHTAQRPIAYLSVEPHADTTIQGIIADVPGGDWAALDLRESGYNRSDVSALTRHEGPPGPLTANSVAVYSVTDWHPGPAHPILLSYLDVVVQGFLQRHGRDGAQRFFDTTVGWSAPIKDDRENPLYPRAQRLTSDEKAFTDAALARAKRHP